MGLEDWEERVKLLEQGISPDDLPINPVKVKTQQYEPSKITEGYFSYSRYSKEENKIVKEWYMLRKLSNEQVKEEPF